MADPKGIGLTSELHEYLLAHGTPPDDIARGLIDETRRVLPERAMMQIAPEQGAFMTMLTSLLDVRFAVEVGTFTGYSALAIARGLPAGGRLLCCDVSETYVAVGRPFWARAGVADRIDVAIAPAADTLAALPAEPTIDLAFIDADKGGYGTYYELILERLAPGGVLLVDNVLWAGAVIDPVVADGDTVAIRAFNDMVAADDRVECVMLPISDGLTMIRHRR
jgi:caffeoyl-CoA O-methyltransferase